MVFTLRQNPLQDFESSWMFWCFVLVLFWIPPSKTHCQGTTSATRILILYSLQPFTRGVVQCNLAEQLVSGNKDSKPITERTSLFKNQCYHATCTWQLSRQYFRSKV